MWSISNLYIRISYESHTSSVSVLAGRIESKKEKRLNYRVMHDPKKPRELNMVDMHLDLITNAIKIKKIY